MNDAPTPAPPDAASHPPLAPSKGAENPNRGGNEGPQIPRFERFLRRLGVRPPHFCTTLDDRGDDLPPQSIDVATLRQLNPNAFKLNANVNVRAIVPICVACAAYFVVWSLLIPFTGRFVGQCVAFGILWIAIRPVIWILSRDGIARHFFIGNMLMAGRCAICGYELRKLTPGTGGFTACPECGGGWHTDRWMASTENVQHALITALSEGMPKGNLRTRMDDRGVYIPDGISCTAPWYTALVDNCRTVMPQDLRRQSFVHEIRAKRDRVLRRVCRNIALCVLVIGVPLIAAVLSLVPYPEDRPGPVLLILILGAPALLLYARSSINGVPLRASSLKHGLCPACGEMLDLSQPRQFDGCIQCAKCAAAWKLDAQPALGKKGIAPAALSQSVTMAPSREGRGHE